MLPVACTILRKFITVFNPGIGSQCNILQKTDKVKSIRRELQSPFFVWVLCEVSDNCNDTEN